MRKMIKMIKETSPTERQTHRLGTFGDNNKGPKICYDQHDDDDFCWIIVLILIFRPL